jgi:signal transduction histidine kinase
MSGVRPRVLLVDDVADLRFLLRVVLEADGLFEVVGEAGDGETAVDLCERTDPDVVLLDLSMPTMDGLEALPRLRALAPTAKIMVLSAFERGRIGPSAADLGADAYVEKGSPPTVVVAELRSLLGMADDAPAVDTVTVLDGEALHGVIAHDLRGPLAAVIGFGDTLVRRWDDLDDGLRRSLVEKLTQQSRLLQVITENLITERAIDLDALVVDVHAVAPASLITDLAPRLEQLCAEHELEVDVAPDLPIVLVDETLLAQVLLNLVANAARYAPADTAVAVHVRDDGTHVAFEVRDEGPGIPIADRARVLEKHARLRRDGRGMGLGLYVAAALTRAMGGSLLLDDVDGVGTSAVCRLRVAAAGG